MLREEIIKQRLKEMASRPDPSNSLWPENCAGSRRALLIFVGPSPGGEKVNKRHDIRTEHTKPLWNESFNDPLGWSQGFRASFQPIVETIIGRPYQESAKLIAIFNMDWLGNPESRDVSYRYMWEGCRHILPVLYECDPQLVIPMDEKTYSALQMALYDDGHEIIPANLDGIQVKINDQRHHRRIMAFESRRKDISFPVIKSLQHPARIYNEEYASRVGHAIRNAAAHFWE
jgi:hypothetical protein